MPRELDLTFFVVTWPAATRSDVIFTFFWFLKDIRDQEPFSQVTWPDGSFIFGHKYSKRSPYDMIWATWPIPGYAGQARYNICSSRSIDSRVIHVVNLETYFGNIINLAAFLLSWKHYWLGSMFINFEIP